MDVDHQDIEENLRVTGQLIKDTYNAKRGTGISDYGLVSSAMDSLDSLGSTP